MPSAAKIEWPQGQPLFEVQWRAVAESLAGNGVLSSTDLEVTSGSSAMGIDVGSGTAYYLASESTMGSSRSHTLTEGDADHDRWDTVYFDTSSGTSGVREGTPEQYPEPPDVQGQELLLAVVYIPAQTTVVDAEQILNWRAQFSNEAEEIHYDDGTGVYGIDSVSDALDSLEQAAQLSSYPLALDTDTEASGYPFPNSDLANSTIDVNTGTGLTTTNASIGLGGSTTLSIPSNGISMTELDAPFSLSNITDSDLGGEDLEDGGTVVWDSSEEHVPRTSIDDKQTTTGPHTSSTITSGEEVVLVDTSNSGVTITLASADANNGNFVNIVDIGGVAATNNITVDTEGSESIDGGNFQTIEANYSALIVFSDGDNWFTAGGSGASSGGIDVEDGGSVIVPGTTSINFGNDLSVADDGDGTVTINSDAAGISVLDSGTFAHTGGSMTSETITEITANPTTNLYVEVGVDEPPSFSADYAWDYTETIAWDDSNGQQDVTIDATWVTDPGSGNDVILDYRIYTLDISVSKSRIQDIIDSPNGNIPTSLLEDGESVEMSVPVPDGEVLKVYQWGCYKISDGTAPTGLEVQLLDDSDTVQASANLSHSKNTSMPVASHGNTSGSMSIFKLRVMNNTGSDFTTDGVGAIFSYVVESSSGIVGGTEPA